ncbi:hypothetical protein OPV22_000734 [Ensete ventricosum]|uniref:Uncharacterized protein n=1 Tax=Ensete ventricosum TaxID=4639 RepID=A0AAV8RPY5_ENSVE|nr:hypothetical protein OPV22_000734 [Ensete ventricosum]
MPLMERCAAQGVLTGNLFFLCQVTSSVDVSRLSVLSCGSAVPLWIAVLHELEKFHVHSLGLPSLLSDPSAKTPEEAFWCIYLVKQEELLLIFGGRQRVHKSII